VFDTGVRQQVYDWSNVAGPVAAAYELCLDPVTVIVGPTGAGKTIASARKILRVALNQHPSPRDGVRKARVCCVAPSYRVLWDTAVPSYLKVFPQSAGKWTGGRGEPADHVMDWQMPDGSKLHLEVQFRAFSGQSAEEFMRGREVTAWWFPEMDTHDAEDALSLAFNRRGRYPEPDDRPDDPDGRLPKAYAGIFGDANAPVIGSWFHKRFYLERKPSDRLFRQPAYDDPRAENLHNLAKINPDYYRDLAAGMSDYDINRLLRCKPGWSRNGKPVHDLFDDATMVSHQRIDAVEGVVLEIGADAGNTLAPAATFGQRVMTQQRVLAEVASKDQQMDLIQFAVEIRRVRETRFAHVKTAVITVDPSARAKSTLDRQVSFAQILQAHSGISVRLAPSNNPNVRRTALDNVLKRRDGYMISGPDCPVLIEALAGGYGFIRRAGRDGQWSEVPDKAHPFSDIAEAEQYRLMGSEGLSAVEGGFIPPRVARRQSGPSVILQS
jgi:hypothetical protein